MKTTTIEEIPRCDYEGSRYQSEFWNEGRSYEDLAERIALKAMIPPRGRRIVEVGAGAGRLGDLYDGYDEIYLVDYAASQLEQAHARWGHDPRYRFVQGDIYSLPFPDGYFDTVVIVRVLHHVKELALALREVARITAPRGTYLTEFANKRHLKAMLRYLLKRGKAGENPFLLAPYEFVPLNIDFHPRYVYNALGEAGFWVQDERAVSFFRVPLLKKLLPAKMLARVDGWLQKPLQPLRITPSIFLRSYRPEAAGTGAEATGRWRCPNCHHAELIDMRQAVRCDQCGSIFPYQNGIYHFRANATE